MQRIVLDPMTISKSLMSKFQKGSDMGKGQACRSRKEYSNKILRNMHGLI